MKKETPRPERQLRRWCKCNKRIWTTVSPLEGGRYPEICEDACTCNIEGIIRLKDWLNPPAPASKPDPAPAAQQANPVNPYPVPFSSPLSPAVRAFDIYQGNGWVEYHHLYPDNDADLPADLLP